MDDLLRYANKFLLANKVYAKHNIIFKFEKKLLYLFRSKIFYFFIDL